MENAIFKNLNLPYTFQGESGNDFTWSMISVMYSSLGNFEPIQALHGCMSYETYISTYGGSESMIYEQKSLEGFADTLDNISNVY